MGTPLNYRGLTIPFTSFGNITSNDLFGDKEQALFDFYERSRGRYRRVLDIGANIGVHSILMARQGWEVMAFEPDPEHYKRLLENVRVNGVVVGAQCAAVSDYHGEAEFTRVLGNTTGSHLTGLKQPYGALETITVKVIDASSLLPWADFAKIDAEGAEAAIVQRLGRCDMMLEVGSLENARVIWWHLQNIGRKSWTQQSGWQETKALADVPKHHAEGALFVGEWRPSATVTA